MKTKNLIQFVLFSLLLTSCATTSNFYQVCKTTPEKDIKLIDNFLIYEDDNCKVLYNLWENGGNIGFTFLNKTTTNIYLNLEECFFVINGNANNYYKNRVYSYTTNTGLGQSIAKSMTGINYLELVQTNSAAANTISTQGTTVSLNEEKIICIPAMTSKSIKEYNIIRFPYRDCDLLRFPNKKQIKTLSFTKENSPIVYSNRIEYKVGQAGKIIKLENNFFVSEITNYPKSEIIESKRDTNCGQVSVSQYLLTEYFKNVSPDKFYISYIYEGEWKH